jgi:hypothetical protein
MGLTSRMSFEPTTHPPTTQDISKGWAYAKAMDLLAYVCRVAESDLPDRVARVAGSRGAPRIEFHSLSLWNWGRDFERVLKLYNDAWSDNAWATPLSGEEAKLISRLTLPVSRPSWIRIATFDGEDVAVAAQIPDANEALKGLQGRLWPFGFARLLWRIHVRHTHDARANHRGGEEVAQHQSRSLCGERPSRPLARGCSKGGRGRDRI